MDDFAGRSGFGLVANQTYNADTQIIRRPLKKCFELRSPIT